MKPDWPEATVDIVTWIVIAITVIAVAHCTYKQTEAHEETCRTKAVCIN